MSRLLLLLVVSCQLLVSSCARETWRAPMALPSDSVPPPTVLQAKKVTFEGPVTFTTQTGAGHVATSAATDNTKAGQKRGTAATGAGSDASSKQAGTAWWVFGLFLLGGAVLGFWVRGKLPAVPLL
ncbi:hypothetical protein ACFQT0_19420 [Hymenobacter humi]|uniref:Uncharacterized protein n=1 Tax=Hymenobacter humi TaxID=1411620 RepID=A0ABW2U867_9BACT